MTTPNAFNALIESIQLSRENTDRFIQANTEAQQETARAIAQMNAQMGNKIDKLSDTVSNQSASIDRLERAVSNLVSGIREQKDGIERMVSQQADFLRLATRQADIIENLTKGKAS